MARHLRFFGHCAIATLLVGSNLPIAIAHPGSSLSTVEIDRLYREGVRARLAGRTQEALEQLSRAAAAAPDNVDVLIQQGLALMAMGRDEQATIVMERVLTLAPNYADARIALARIALRQGHTNQALAQVESVLRDDPNNPEARELHAGVLLSQGDARASEAEYRTLARQQPGSASVLVGLGDSLRAQWRDEEARVLYSQAAALAPDSVGRQRAELPDRPRFRLDINGAYSSLSNGLPPWQEGSLRLAYTVDDRNVVSIGSDVSRRFNMTNAYTELRVDHRYTERLSAYLYGGGTPDATILPEAAIGMGAQWRMNASPGKQLTFATLDTRYAHYQTGNVWSGNAGLIQYLGNDRIWITAKWINTLDERSRYLTGFALRGDWQARPQLRLLAGYADAPESDQGITVRTRTVYGGVVVDATDRVSVNLTAAHEMRSQLYDRNTIDVGLTLRF